jgi:hypothetical protein
VFGNHAHPVVNYLKKSATYGEATDGPGTADCQWTLTEQRHERSVVRQDTDLSVKSRRDYSVGFTVEHRRLG